MNRLNEEIIFDDSFKLFHNVIGAEIRQLHLRGFHAH